MEIEKQNADSLPYYLRQQVIEACQKRAKLTPFLIGFCAVFSVAFILVAFLVPAKLLAEADIYDSQKLIVRIICLLFLILPIMLIYRVFIRPRKLVKLAQEEKYSCYIGVLTDKKVKVHRSSNGNSTRRYYLHLDDTVICQCSYEEHKNAVTGEQYLAVWFGKKEPELCLKITA